MTVSSIIIGGLVGWFVGSGINNILLITIILAGSFGVLRALLKYRKEDEKV